MVDLTLGNLPRLHEIETGSSVEHVSSRDTPEGAREGE